MNALEERRTARLHLRRLRAEDFDDLDRMHQDTRVMATLGGIRTEEQTRDLLTRLLANWDVDGFGYWVGHDISTGRFVARGGLRAVEVGGRKEVEVGYAVMSEYWGRGLATELAVESVRVGFTELRQASLVCFTLPTNRASQRVMMKAGFCFECDTIWADLPHVLYRLTAAQWQERSAAGESRS